ncbi:uncharacterized protein LOC123520688 isoform X2 [Portunus trituberculatus]|uniref:uncharacterized protein LOC123520688 isoform X2 n=1 Tax=Portunus trituberculatus TaxID=210409 RepID=UPI001E1CF76F|nr:uncharacterized protein LOC123520688 isoform X2 [Portunus trituberculatus]
MNRWKMLAGSTVIFLPAFLYCISRSSFSFPHITSGIDRLGRVAFKSSKLQTVIGPKPQDDLVWWEAEDCQCKTEECRELSVTFKSSVKEELSGTCGRRPWNAGSKMLSFSFYGTNPDYWRGLEHILLEVKKLYPGWNVRLYTNPRNRAAILCPLLHRYSSLLYICDITSLPHPLGNLSNVHPMMWRVVPLGDSEVAAMLIRDTDSQVSQRELAAVEEWLASGKMFHVMRDHPQHGTPVLGGLWDARWDTNPAFATELRHLRNKMLSMAINKTKYGLDQEIIKKVLWPKMIGSLVAHDSYTCKSFKGSSPWPSQRLEGDFVGRPRCLHY